MEGLPSAGIKFCRWSRYRSAGQHLRNTHRRDRIYKIEDGIEELNNQALQEKTSEVSKDTNSELPAKKTRKRKKGSKSGIIINSTFPSEIDFNHPYRQVIMAIKTKPFLLITGMCGTGKSRFARTLAYQTCPKYLQEDGIPGNFQMIAVQPEWSDSTELLGWLTLQGTYKFTPFLHFLIKSWRYTDTPFILCLDEVNLAKVEQYFADFLSIIESRQWINNEFASDAFISGSQMKFYSDRDPNMWERIGLKLDSGLQNSFLSHGIRLPPNLIVIGTANMDDAGQRFSTKLLDRVSVLEMNEIDFYAGIRSDDVALKFPATPISNDKILGRLLSGKDAYTLSPQNGDLIISELQALNKIFTGTSFRFGYRVRDASLIYCAYNSQLSGNPNTKETIYKCLDEIILMKILPRISGEAAKKVIDSLLRFTKLKYTRSYQRILLMQSESNEYFGISFWQ